jgi:diaminopimelate epimerase
MTKIPFIKYTHFGNNFVIVDETTDLLLSEQEKSRFAYQATNISFGIGSDNLLVIQACHSKTLENIQRDRHYWEHIPSPDSADFIFRMFEPDGKEALCCGNGLICVADYLCHQYGIDNIHIMTEIPLATPNVIAIGTEFEESLSWVNLGYPRRMPKALINPTAAKPFDDDIDIVDNLEVTFRNYDLKPFTDAVSLSLSGYLIFTGEPHLVIFPNSGLSVATLGETLFPGQIAATTTQEKRVNFGSWLMDHIGNHINKYCAEIFPAGININFAHIDERTGKVMYRCFERGINKETLACGTGALAVAYVAERLNRVSSNLITVIPHRCTWDLPGAQFQVKKETQGWSLHGRATRLVNGTFMLTSPNQRRLILDPAERRRIILKGHLRDALARNELFLNFQPQIGFDNNPVVGVEALLRWYNHEVGLISPQEFIPLAEETGLMVSIGEWVLLQACQQMKIWQHMGLNNLRLSVNLSSRQLKQADLPDKIETILSSTGLKPGFLDLEISEGTLTKNYTDTIRKLYDLEALGVGLALDNFGAISGNLRQLSQTPIDRLKIDQSFIKEIANASKAASFTQALIAAAHSLDLKVTAEGVETEKQCKLLEMRGCDEMQGYFFSRPVASGGFIRWLREAKTNAQGAYGKSTVQEFERTVPVFQSIRLQA